MNVQGAHKLTLLRHILATVCDIGMHCLGPVKRTLSLQEGQDMQSKRNLLKALHSTLVQN